MRTAEQQRAYRAERKALGTPVPPSPSKKRRKHDIFDAPFLAWDGEGVTIDIPRGFSRAQFELERERAARDYLETQALADAPFFESLHEHGGFIVPDIIGERGRWRARGEFAEIPPQFLRPNKKRNPEGVAYGNIDEITATARILTGDDDLTDSDVLAFFRSYKRPSLKEARTIAEEQLQRPNYGRHIYTLLANSSGDYVENIDGISTEAAFEFLIKHSNGRHAKASRRNHVIFAGSYDANMMLADVDREGIGGLWKATTARTMTFGRDTYRVRYRPRKEFYLARLHRSRPFVTTPGTGTALVANIERSMSLWDVWGFFQSSFVGACTANLDQDEQVRYRLAEIAEMKKERSSFDVGDRERIRAYCFDELRALDALMEHVRKQLREAEIIVRRWDGAGAVSKALLRKHGVGVHREETSDGMRDIIARTYGGGRIEITAIGRHVGQVVDCDLQSAYPAAATELPAMAGGHWYRTRKDGGRFSVSKIFFRFPLGRSWYPLPYRESNGAILFPAEGRGWYWGPERDAAIAYANRFGGIVDIERTMTFVPATNVRPFAWVPDVFAQRAEWKATGRSGEKMLKLGLNGSYGATAQQVGKAPFFQIEWAGFITSATRARLVFAGLNDPDAVVMFATDGIFTVRDLGLAYAKGLGEWERTAADEIVIAQAGVYWYRQGDVWTARNRGFDRDRLQSPLIALDAWRDGAKGVDIPTTRFVTMGSALASAEGWKAWRNWVTVDRRLDLTGSSEKRYYSRADSGRFDPANRLVSLTVKEPIDPNAVSAPYPVTAWGNVAPSPYDLAVVEADEMDEAYL